VPAWRIRAQGSETQEEAVPHVSERQPQDDDVKRQERTEGPDAKPSGKLGGHPINADETAPREVVPEPSEGGGTTRHPEAVDDEPGSDL
jgi:hypothetical protein